MRSSLLFVLLSIVACSSQDSAPDAAAPTSSDGGVDATPDDGTDDTTTTDAATHASFSPQAIAADKPELANPLRGQYLWLGTPPSPASWPDVDGYSRWNWAQLEPTRGNYQWKLIDDQLAAARARRGRWGMRIMALCQGCADHTYKGAKTSIPDDLADAVNPLIGAPPGESDSYLIPDWNSEAYFGRLTELVTAISNRYKDDPHFAWVDVFSYGNWGEMHLYPFNQPGGPYDHSTQRPLTDANAKRLVQLNAQAFANKLLVVNSEQRASVAAAVASVSPPIGIRVDCLGSDGLAGGADPLQAVPGASDRWKTAPFVTEWCQHNLGSSGADLFVQGEAQVRQYHVSMLSSGNFDAPPQSQAQIAAFRKANVEAGYRLRTTNVTLDLSRDRKSLRVVSTWTNDNVAPTYLAWRAVLGLRKAGANAIEKPLTIELRNVLPGTPRVDDVTMALPTALSKGKYEVFLRVDDVQQVSVPMQLAMEGRGADGSYTLGTLTVR